MGTEPCAQESPQDLSSTWLRSAGMKVLVSIMPAYLPGGELRP